MRGHSLISVFGVVAAVVVLLGCIAGGASAQFGHRRAALMARARQEAADRLRRGFQNSALATARGFGKRSDATMQGEVVGVVPRSSITGNDVDPRQLIVTDDLGSIRSGTEQNSINTDNGIEESMHKIARLIEAARSGGIVMPWNPQRNLAIGFLHKRSSSSHNDISADER